MWKAVGLLTFAIAFTIISTNSIDVCTESIDDEFADSEIDDAALDGSKIAEGVKPNRTVAKEYALISISFVNQKQICGGTLIRPHWVLTSATCLSDPVEGLGSYVYVALGKTMKLRYNFTKIVIHPDYDYTTHKADIGLLQLSKDVDVNKNKNIAFASFYYNSVTDIWVGNILYYCGWGDTMNMPTPPKKLLCTELLAIPSANCSTNSNIICTRWPQRDNNVCAGDFGGPLYLGAGGTGVVIGLAAWAPDMRPNAHCTDGHLTEHTNLFAYDQWIVQNVDCATC